MMTKSSGSKMPLIAPPPGKHVLPTRDIPLSGVEQNLMSDLDPDKLSELAEVLFAFNNYKVGPMPGFYVAIEIDSGETWCVGQLCADRAKPLKVFDKKRYKTAKGAQRAAERMRKADLEALAADS